MTAKFDLTSSGWIPTAAIPRAAIRLTNALVALVAVFFTGAACTTASADNDVTTEKTADAGNAKQTISRPIWLLVDAKTQEKIQAGNRGINNLKRPDVPKRVEVPMESAATRTLRDVKLKSDRNGERFPASRGTLAAFNRDWTVKSVNMTLADDSVMECRALVRMDNAQAVNLEKDLIMAHTIEADGDEGVQTWYCYVSTYEAPVVLSVDAAGHKRARHGVQGTWRIVSSQHTGDTFLFEENPAGLKVIVTGDTLAYYSRDGRGRYEGRVHLDPVTKAFDWGPAYSGIGALTGTTVPFRGIYELKGDELKIYFHESKWERPKAFDFKEGWLLVLNRDKTPADNEKPLEAIPKPRGD